MKPGALNVRSWFAETRRTLALATPIMAGLVGQMLMGVADTLMVGRVGTTALAASALGFHLSHVLLVTGLGLIYGISVFTSHAFGAKRPADAAEVFRHGIWLSLIIGFASATLLGLARNRLTWPGQPQAVVREASAYVLLVAWSLVPILVANAVKQFSEALSCPWKPMLIFTGGVLLNILLNWVFIYGNCGAPALGVTGAGLATLLARVATLAGMVTLVLFDGTLKAWMPRSWWCALSGRTLLRMIRFGASVGLLQLLEVGAFAFAALMTGWLGAEAMAANQIAITCAATTFMFALGVAMATSIRVGHAWGAGQRVKVRRVGFAGMVTTALIMAGFAAVLLAARGPLAGLFTPDAEVVRLAATLLLVAGFFQLFDGQQVAALFSLRGVGDVKVPAWVAVVAYWLLAVPTGYVLGFRLKLGALGIWIGLAMGLATVAVVLGVRFARITRLTP